MNKETMESLDFKKKPYAAPQMEVYKVKSANIIATSTRTQDLGYDPNEYQF